MYPHINVSCTPIGDSEINSLTGLGAEREANVCVCRQHHDPILQPRADHGVRRRLRPRQPSGTDVQRGPLHTLRLQHYRHPSLPPGVRTLLHADTRLVTHSVVNLAAELFRMCRRSRLVV